MKREGEEKNEGEKGKSGKQAVRMEEQLEGSCKKGMGDSTATYRRIWRIDSKIYDMRREREVLSCEKERDARDYIVE